MEHQQLCSVHRPIYLNKLIYNRLVKHQTHITLLKCHLSIPQLYGFHGIF